MVHIHRGSSSFAIAEGSNDEDDGGNHLPIVDCPRCHLAVVKLQSKTIKNPGRWFYKCPNHDTVLISFLQCPNSVGMG